MPEDKVSRNLIGSRRHARPKHLDLLILITYIPGSVQCPYCISITIVQENNSIIIMSVVHISNLQISNE